MDLLNATTSNTFCAAPWVSRFVTPFSVAPCCYSHASELTDPGFVLLKQQLLNGEKPAKCFRCWRDEEAGSASGRQLYNSLPFSPDISVYEVRLHAVCNLSCNICSPLVSSSVQAEQTRYPEIQRLHQAAPLSNGVNINPSRYLTESVNLLKISGGEPFMLEQPLTDLLSQAKLTNSNMAIRINTNGATVVPPAVANVLTEFNNVSIIISLDDVGSLFEYHRFGSRFSTVEENIRLWQSSGFTVGVHCSVSLYNIASLLNIYKFCVQQRILDLKFSFVHTPPAVSLRHTSDFVAPYVLSALEELDKVQFFRALASRIRAELRYAPTVTPLKTLEFLRSFDRARKVEVDTIYPELIACLVSSSAGVDSQL